MSENSGMTDGEDLILADISAIEDRIACGEIGAPAVFTRMRSHLKNALAARRSLQADRDRLAAEVLRLQASIAAIHAVADRVDARVIRAECEFAVGALSPATNSPANEASLASGTGGEVGK